MPKRKPRRPWIKVLDRDGKVIQRCRDITPAIAYFVHYKNWSFHEKGFRLLLDNIEYNAPIRYAGELREFDSYAEAHHKVYEQLKYLVDLHISFYY